MDAERSQQLRDIIQLSRDMLASAADNDWVRVAELEVRRREQVLACFNRPTDDADAVEVAAVIRDVLRLNQEIAELGERCKEALGDQLRTHGIGRTARQAYQNCAR